MGLNMNYNLLLEGNNSVSIIPEYRNYDGPDVFIRSELTSYISEFNQEMMESRLFLSNLCEMKCIDEGVVASIANGIRYVVEKVRDAIVAVFRAIIDALKKVIEAIKKLFSKNKSKADNLKPSERITILRQVIAEDPTLAVPAVADIHATDALLSDDFPDTSILGGDLVNMLVDTMDNYCTNMNLKDGSDASYLDTEIQASESFASFIDSEKNKLLSQVFGRYSYDETGVIQSARSAATLAFGSSALSDVKLTEDLYTLACENLNKESLEGINKKLNAKYAEVTKSYNKIQAQLDKIKKEADRLDKYARNTYGVDMKARYHEATKTITSRISTAFNAIQNVIAADYTILAEKLVRSEQIFGAGGSSAKIKLFCDTLILKKVASKVGYDIDNVNYVTNKNETFQYYTYDKHLNEGIGASRESVLNKVKSALADAKLTHHISKNGDWGSSKFLDGKSDSLSLGSFGRDTYAKACEVVKNALPKGFKLHKDNYNSIFIEAPKAVDECYDTYNAFSESEDIFQVQDDFNSAVSLIEEAFYEDQFTDLMMEAIYEAEGDAAPAATGSDTGSGDAAAKPQPTENNTSNQNTVVVKKTGTDVKNFVKKIMAALGDAMRKFRARIDELLIKNPMAQSYWKKNKDGIKKLSLTDSKVNDWYDYKTEYFTNSTVIPFDVNGAEFKSDQALQEAILKKICNNGALPEFGKDDSFAKKINKVYQGEYFHTDDNKGFTLTEVKYDHNKAYELVDSMLTNGLGAPAFGKVIEDYKTEDADYKKTLNNYDSLLSQMKPSNNPEAPANNNADAQKTEPQKNEAANMVEDDFRFNLAEHFGLYHHEATFTVGENDAKSAAENGANEAGSSGGTVNKELDAMIKRCYQLNTIAITAKMTCIIAAYKQYFGLFKSVYKARKPKATEGKPAEGNKQEAKK